MLSVQARKLEVGSLEERHQRHSNGDLAVDSQCPFLLAYKSDHVTVCMRSRRRFFLQGQNTIIIPPHYYICELQVTIFPVHYHAI